MKALISFEGGEGCGKSTQVKLLADYFSKLNLDFITTREPGGSLICEKIRELLLYEINEDMSNITQILLFSASRAQLLHKIVRPALNENKIVILDRYYDSTFAYQGFGNGIELDLIQKATDIAVSELEPDITFYFDIDPVLAFSRKTNNINIDRFEKQDMEFHKRIRQGYLTLSQIHKNRYYVIDATKSIEDITKEIISVLTKKGII